MGLKIKEATIIEEDVLSITFEETDFWGSRTTMTRKTFRDAWWYWLNTGERCSFNTNQLNAIYECCENSVYKTFKV